MRENIIKVGGKPYTTYTYQDTGERKIDLTPTAERPFPRFSKQPKPLSSFPKGICYSIRSICQIST